jgi:hypothetical protein
MLPCNRGRLPGVQRSPGGTGVSLAKGDPDPAPVASPPAAVSRTVSGEDGVTAPLGDGAATDDSANGNG